MHTATSNPNMLGVIMLNVIMLSVIMLSAMAPSYKINVKFSSDVVQVKMKVFESHLQN
jgi:hypothetical protein